MGWSCTAAADDTLRKWEAVCRESTGSSNAWTELFAEYFFEVGAEQDDGAVVGDVFKSTDEKTCWRSGGFRVEPDGTVSEAPYFLTQKS